MVIYDLFTRKNIRVSGQRSATVKTDEGTEKRTDTTNCRTYFADVVSNQLHCMNPRWRALVEHHQPMMHRCNRF